MQAGLLGWTPFDPMGMNSDSMALKEVKNGRLAMLAFIGFCSQAAVQVCTMDPCMNPSARQCQLAPRTSSLQWPMGYTASGMMSTSRGMHVMPARGSMVPPATVMCMDGIRASQPCDQSYQWLRSGLSEERGR